MKNCNETHLKSSITKTTKNSKKETQEYNAYQGTRFTIEWYFNTSGKSQALEYFNILPLDRAKKMAYLLEVLGDQGKLFNEEKFRYEGDQLYVFKPAQDRFFCFFFDGAKIIITNAYEKKSAKMPLKEKQKALNAKKDYITRVQSGNYYD